MTALLSDALEKIGTVDILVNSQGVNKEFPGTEFPASTWSAMFDASVKPVMLTCRHFGRYMKVHDVHSRIVSLSPVIGIRVVDSGGGANAGYVTFNPKTWERPADHPFPIREPETTFCSGSVRFIRPNPDGMPAYQPIAQYLTGLKIKRYLGAQHAFYNDPCDYFQVYRVK